MAKDVAKKNLTENPGDGVQELVYGISHDMGAPLRSVVQFTQLLKSRIDDRLDDKERYWLQLVEENGYQAQQMVSALLIYSRLTTQRLASGTFSLRDALDSALAEIENNTQAKQASIEISGDFPDITGDESQWVVFFSCLIDNALLYQPNVAGHEITIEISCTLLEGEFTLSVQDNGIGVPENQYAVLTSPFKRLQPPKDYPGIGMGLTYCQRICQLHNKTLTFGPSSLGGLSVSCCGEAEGG